MDTPYKIRKKVHLLLFVFVIILQATTICLWLSQSTEEKNQINAYSNSNTSSLAFSYSNEASKHYFNAESEFMEYLHNYDASLLKRYEASLYKMTLYLDSLNALVKKEKSFREFISDKKKKEKEIISLRLELEKILKANDFSDEKRPEENELLIKPYNYRKVLNSITYDSIRIEDEAIRKGLLGRITDAFSGKTSVRREQVFITMTMNYGNETKTGTIEDQMKNVFVSTRRHYNKEFKHLKSTYSGLKKKDQELLKINRTILNNSQEIILFYNDYIQHTNKAQFENASKSIDSKKNQIFILLGLMAICTLLLLGYSRHAYMYQRDLSIAKTEAENSLKFRNRIIGMLSHEMRAPLNIISSITAKLKTADPEEKAKDLNLLHFTSNSLQITVSQILNYFKSENSKLILYNSKTQLYQEIKSILASMESLAQSKGIDFNYNLSSDLNKEVYIDAGKLHQLFYNLIGNAIKFTDKGSITVQCQLNGQKNHEQLQVTITDTGIGIPEKDLKKVFDRFYQSENSKSKISFGAGLGLNICKEIVANYNGRIEIESQVNKGSRITFDLLLENASVPQRSSEQMLIELFKDKPIKVALVDDDKMVVAILKKLLANVHFTPVAFSFPDEIRDYLETNDADLIITDIQLGPNSGIDLVQDIKDLKNRNSKVPIMVITGDEYMSSVSLEKLLIDEIIIKPINKEEFYSKILKLLQQNTASGW